ncbi:MAG: hypothetical protein LBR05_02550 [Azoarcus sp.]|jgi:hypothetical protein|nr:hypothetical protein [Azoarcus sp.]
MSGFGHYDRTAAELEDEIVTRGVLIGIDWTDPAQVRSLAAEALTCTSEQRLAMLHHHDPKVRAKGELFALSELMLDIMRQSAQTGVHVPDVGVWDAFGNALNAAAHPDEAPTKKTPSLV